MPDDTPTEKALAMRQQGLSNNQIIASLQREGYTTNQILDALNQADISEQTKKPFEGGNMAGPNDLNNPNIPNDPNAIPASGVPVGAAAPGTPLPAGTASNMPGTALGAPAEGMPVGGDEAYDEDINTRVEELVESVIDEKWSDFMDNINRIVEWKEKTESRINEIESTVKKMKDDFDKLHASILERVGDYDKHIADVGTEVKALEKVFQKVLPGFMENVAELSRITEELKKK